MECAVCGHDVENSEDLKKHMELAHPMGASDEAMDNLEGPGPLEDTPEESVASESTQATR